MRPAVAVLPCALLATFVGIGGARAEVSLDEPIATLRGLSIEELSQLEVTSVSRAPLPLSEAPSSIYVITREEIRRSGAVALADILRLAPNLDVARLNGGEHAVSARGFGGNNAAQNFPNKLLVLVDGRTVYSPLFSGVYWDMQHVPVETIDRIEVISGPGAALWGANAFGGVINVVTRDAHETDGVAADIAVGTRTSIASLVAGDQLSPDAAFRIYASGAWTDETEVDGQGAGDDWRRPQAGFRLDLAPPGRHAFTVQGDIFGGARGQRGAGDETIAGHNVLARWVRTGDRSETRAQAFYDYVERSTEGGGRFDVDTFDIEAQQSFGVGVHDIVWGGGLRSARYRIDGTEALSFEPSTGVLDLANFFVQDTIALPADLRVTLGLKAEDGPFHDVEWLPNARLSWTPNPRWMLWSAVSRAIRSPTPFDTDVQERVGGVLFLRGDPAFRSEQLVAYEAGLRTRPLQNATVSVSMFYNDYEDIRSIEPAPVGFLPLQWGNRIEGSSYGLEAWGSVDVRPWWRLGASYALLESDLGFEDGASGILGLAQNGYDPRHRASITSAMTFGTTATVDAKLRYVDELPYSEVPSYVELDGRIAWTLNDRVEVALVGFNLLDEDHQERPPPALPVNRELLAELRVRY